MIAKIYKANQIAEELAAARALCTLGWTPGDGDGKIWVYLHNSEASRRRSCSRCSARGTAPPSGQLASSLGAAEEGSKSSTSSRGSTMLDEGDIAAGKAARALGWTPSIGDAIYQTLAGYRDRTGVVVFVKRQNHIGLLVRCRFAVGGQPVVVHSTTLIPRSVWIQELDSPCP